MSVRKRGKRAFQVRIAPFPAKTFPTREAAEKYELELRLRRSQGDRYVEPSRTFGEELDAWLARQRTTGGLRAATVRFNERSAVVWAPFRGVKLVDLRRAPLEDFIAARAADHPRSARNELELLKRVLGDARGRGQRIDERVFGIPPIRHRPREGRALTVAELYELASWFPEHSNRLVLLAGMVGSRQRVWFELTDDLLNLDEGTMSVPAALAKRGKEHRVYLTSVDQKLFREQLMLRAPGTALVFPTPTGCQWNCSGFRERVWAKSVAAAVKNDHRSVSVFEGFTFHFLRHTAGSLMARAGMDPAVAAERMEHSDGGALFLRTYRHLYEEEKRFQAGRLDEFVRRHLDSTWTDDEAGAQDPLNQADAGDGRSWDRTSDLPRVKRALSR